MKDIIFLDTNVVIDLLGECEPFYDAIAKIVLFFNKLNVFLFLLKRFNQFTSMSVRFSALRFAFTTIPMAFLVGCADEDNRPVVRTSVVTNITTSSAHSGGNVLQDFGYNIIERGVCWSINPNPTIKNFKTIDGVGTGLYQSELFGLITGTNYYARAYATNQFGTGYGKVLNFSTLDGRIDITTSVINRVDSYSVISGGNIKNDGGEEVFLRGIVWDTIPNPTLQQNMGMTSDGLGIGEFNSSIEGLYPGKKYYYRSFATNSIGTCYGNVRSFINLHKLDYFIDSRDGNMYQTVKLGNQIWMAENLAYLPSVTDPSIGSRSEPCYYVYNYIDTIVSDAKLTSYYQTYGVLYNWHAAMISCPEGWHLPTDEEWTELENYVGNNPDYFEEPQNATATGIAKALAFETGWASSQRLGAVGNPYYDFKNVQNATGFSALAGGYRETHEKLFLNLGKWSYFWSSSLSYENKVINRVIYYDYHVFGKQFPYKHYGYSVRCVKN